MMTRPMPMRYAHNPQTIGVLNCMIAMVLMTRAATVAGSALIADEGKNVQFQPADTDMGDAML